jgi:hypothetical protein
LTRNKASAQCWVRSPTTTHPGPQDSGRWFCRALPPLRLQPIPVWSCMHAAASFHALDRAEHLCVPGPVLFRRHRRRLPRSSCEMSIAILPSLIMVNPAKLSSTKSSGGRTRATGSPSDGVRREGIDDTPLVASTSRQRTMTVVSAPAWRDRALFICGLLGGLADKCGRDAAKWRAAASRISPALQRPNWRR